MKAPNAIDRPAAAAARPAPITTRRQAAMNSSSLLARATDFIIGLSTSRPTSRMATGARTAGARRRASATPVDGSWPPSRDRATRIGATARSWNSSTEKVARPVSLCRRRLSARAGTMMAVDDRASPAPISTAAGTLWPARRATAAIAAVDSTAWIAPMPNTQRRSRRSRSHDSSSPTMNRRNTTPNSASSAMSPGWATARGASQGAWRSRAPRPNGPSTTPAPRKPRIGLTFRRLNRGTTTPAVARNRTTSRYSPGLTPCSTSHLRLIACLETMAAQASVGNRASRRFRAQVAARR